MYPSAGVKIEDSIQVKVHLLNQTSDILELNQDYMPEGATSKCKQSNKTMKQAKNPSFQTYDSKSLRGSSIYSINQQQTSNGDLALMNPPLSSHQVSRRTN